MSIPRSLDARLATLEAQHQAQEEPFFPPYDPPDEWWVEFWRLAWELRREISVEALMTSIGGPTDPDASAVLPAAGAPAARAGVPGMAPVRADVRTEDEAIRQGRAADRAPRPLPAWLVWP